MHRKITQNQFCLGKKYFDDHPCDCVSIRVVNRELIITPYQMGDENREDIIIRTPDVRRRILLPHELVRAAGISDYVDVVIELNGTAHITHLDAKKVGMRRKNA